LDDVVYPETREKMQLMKQEAADRKADMANEAAYNKASGMKKGGSASSRADGIAEKGKTKGKQIKMAGSGVPGGIGSKVMKKGGMC
jgi:hypothetical protein